MAMTLDKAWKSLAELNITVWIRQEEARVAREKKASAAPARPQGPSSPQPAAPTPGTPK